MVMLRHPLSRTEYHRCDDGTVRVIGKDGKEGRFTRLGDWISGDRKSADPAMCRWIADAHLRGAINANVNATRPRLD
jgi:hypothetical protein